MTKRGTRNRDIYHQTARADSRLGVLGPEHRDTFERYRRSRANILESDACDLDDLNLPGRVYRRSDSIRYPV